VKKTEELTMIFEGIYTPVITPYAADGQIDRQAFAEVLESLIAAKVHGIIIAGSTGEYYAHTPQERCDLAAYARQVIGTRLPLIVGTGATRTEDSVAYAKAAKEIGADAILVTSPPYAIPTEEENAVHALTIDKAAGLPIMLYNYPARMGVMMGERYFTRVSESKNVVAIKESSGTTANIHLLALQFPNIALCCGWDDQALEFFAWGARSWVCAASNFLPAEHIALYEACVLQKDFDKGRAIMAAMMPLMDLLEIDGKFVQKIKHGCETIGLRAGAARAPLGPMTGEEKVKLETVIATLKKNVAKVTSAKVDA
jgi:4-hydroxy-tetrahydrodipicolinate synthase